MKKLITLSLLGLTLASFTSCKKDWTCTCIDGYSSDVTLMKDKTKKDAKAACDLLDTFASGQGGHCNLDKD